MIPQRLSKALAKQNIAVLYEIRDLVESLIAERNEAKLAAPTKKEVIEEKKSAPSHTGWSAFLAVKAARDVPTALTGTATGKKAAKQGQSI